MLSDSSKIWVFIWETKYRVDRWYHRATSLLKSSNKIDMRPIYSHGPQILDLLQRSVAEGREARRVKKNELNLYFRSLAEVRVHRRWIDRIRILYPCSYQINDVVKYKINYLTYRYRDTNKRCIIDWILNTDVFCFCF